jgi:hypothetical protein
MAVTDREVKLRVCAKIIAGRCDVPPGQWRSNVDDEGFHFDADRDQNQVGKSRTKPKRRMGINRTRCHKAGGLEALPALLDNLATPGRPVRSTAPTVRQLSAATCRWPIFRSPIRHQKPWRSLFGTCMARASCGRICQTGGEKEEAGL